MKDDNVALGASAYLATYTALEHTSIITVKCDDRDELPYNVHEDKEEMWLTFTLECVHTGLTYPPGKYCIINGVITPDEENQ